MKIITKNFLIERGDAYLFEDRLEIRVPGDWTTYKCTWVVKLNKKESSDRLIEKNNVSAGGSNYEIETILDGGETVFKISLLGENTSNFREPKYYHDLVVVDAVDSTKTKTIAKGDFKINYDIQTPFDGFVIPSENIQYQVVQAADGGVGDIVMINAAGKCEFTSLSNLKMMLDGLS